MVQAGWIMVLAFFCGTAGAQEVSAVQRPNKTQFSEPSWVLNGVGSRVMAGIFHVYEIALYLPHEHSAVSEILDEDLPKRVALTFNVDVKSAQLLEVTYKVMSENHTVEELRKAEAGWQEFSTLFSGVNEIHRNDQIRLDFANASGTQVSLNGRDLGRVNDRGFMRAFLKIWLGERPVQANLKEKLLGLKKISRNE